MQKAWTVAVVALCLLGACVDGSNPNSRLSPPPVDPNGVQEDPLTVGHRLMAAGEYELALKSYLRAASTDGVDAEVLSSIGSANLKLGRLGQAEQILRRALEMDPTFVPAVNNLGVVLMEEGKYGEARRTFEEAYALDSGATDSIRENLRVAIAQSEQNVYPEPSEANGLSLVRKGKNEYELLTDL